MLRITKKSKKSLARATTLTTAHGIIHGPFFMPIATRAAVKNLSMDEVKALGAEIILSNTYHLMLQPGEKLIKKAGGLHEFLQWKGPILTDSGGFQVFSLSNLRKITDEGVTFADPRSGAKELLTPERSMRVQIDLGVDIAMAFDEVVGQPSTRAQVEGAVTRTTAWGKRSLQYFRRYAKKHQMLFGIVQGGLHQDLRERSIKELTELDFDGYAVGGVAVGEPTATMADVLSWTTKLLPENKSRYLMGVGRPEDILLAVRHGIDMFDCVIPTREARHGRLYLWRGKPGITGKHFYQTINIGNAKFAKDFSPINTTNLKQYSKAYLHHLFKTSEALGMRLATLNNLSFYLTLMKVIREEISKGKL